MRPCSLQSLMHVLMRYAALAPPISLITCPPPPTHLPPTYPLPNPRTAPNAVQDPQQFEADHGPLMLAAVIPQLLRTLHLADTRGELAKAVCAGFRLCLATNEERVGAGLAHRCNSGRLRGICSSSAVCRSRATGARCSLLGGGRCSRKRRCVGAMPQLAVVRCWALALCSSALCG